MTRPLGVGVIGAGPVTQAIHLPTLAALADRLQVVHIMDVNADVAASVASRVDARWTTELDALLEDDVVDVVAICSPHQFHAEQVAAVAAAGRRAILCEKPLATTMEEAQRIADVSTTSGVPVVVGAMHAFDPAYVAVKRHWGSLADDATLVRSAICLPANDEFVDLATDLTGPPTQYGGPGELTPEVQAGLIRGAVLGLATHTIPQLRQFIPSVKQVTSARYVKPFGYQIVLEGEDRTAELLAVMPGEWQADWTFQVWGGHSELHIDFPPSYVLAGSATATLRTSDDRRSWHAPINGYQAEWLHVADVAEGKAKLRIPVQDAVADLLFALELADRAAESILEHA